MKLYHGTGESSLKNILEDGIKPRGSENKRSNWKHTVQSRAGFVYLTSAYPFYFAMSATKGKEKCVIIEVDLPESQEWRLHPDEDFIAQAQARQGDETAKGDLLKATKKVDLDQFQHLWDKSLEHLGNVSHRGAIPRGFITRVAVIDVSERKDLMFNFGDPSISIMNFMVMRDTYQGFVSWVFGDRKLLPGMTGMSLQDQERAGGPFKESADATRKMSADRHGIVVTEIGR